MSAKSFTKAPIVAYFVHGRGRGHASRTTSTVPALRAHNIDVRLFGARDAIPLLQSVMDVQPAQLVAPGKGMVRAFASRVRSDIKQLRALQPHVVVSDGDGPSVHAARWLGIPSIAIGHGLLFAHTRLEVDLPIRLRLREAINALSSSWVSQRRIVVHFGPATPRNNRTRVARPDRDAVLQGTPRDDGFILAYFRDDNGTQLVQRLVDRGANVVVFGGPGAAPAGVSHLNPSRADFTAHLMRCTAVIGSAGNHLPTECAYLGKPLLGVWTRADGEQWMNAKLLVDAGIGIAAQLDEVTDSMLDAFMAMRPTSSSRSSFLSLPSVTDVVVDEVLAQTSLTRMPRR